MNDRTLIIFAILAGSMQHVWGMLDCVTRDELVARYHCEQREKARLEGRKYPAGWEYDPEWGAWSVPIKMPDVVAELTAALKQAEVTCKNQEAEIAALRQSNFALRKHCEEMHGR